jgi:hypothetical protein
MARYLVTFNDTYDNVIVTGFSTMTDDEIDEYEDILNSITWEFSINDGALVYSNGEDFLTRIDFKELNKTDADAIQHVFNGEFGTVIGIEYLKKVLNGESETSGFQTFDYDDDDND